MKRWAALTVLLYTLALLKKKTRKQLICNNILYSGFLNHCSLSDGVGVLTHHGI